MDITALQKLFLQKKHQKTVDMNDDGIIDLKDEDFEGVAG
jgi:hypothetical protein